MLRRLQRLLKDYEITTQKLLDASGYWTTDTVVGALNQIGQHVTSAQACAYPFAVTGEDGTALTKFTAGATPGWQQLSNKETVLTWDGNASPTKVAHLFALGNDVDDSADITVHWLCAMAGTTDTPTLGHECYFNKGDTDCAGTDDVVDGGTTLTEYTATIAAANVPASPSGLTIITGPTGTMTTDELRCYGMWLEYTRKFLTS